MRYKIGQTVLVKVKNKPVIGIISRYSVEHSGNYYEIIIQSERPTRSNFETNMEYLYAFFSSHIRRPEHQIFPLTYKLI